MIRLKKNAEIYEFADILGYENISKMRTKNMIDIFSYLYDNEISDIEHGINTGSGTFNFLHLVIVITGALLAFTLFFNISSLYTRIAYPKKLAPPSFSTVLFSIYLVSISVVIFLNSETHKIMDITILPVVLLVLSITGYSLCSKFSDADE